MKIILKKRKKLEQEGIDIQDWMLVLFGKPIKAKKEKFEYSIKHPIFNNRIYLQNVLIENEIEN